MKAASAILTGAQRPLMLFGIPQPLFMLSAAGGSVAFMVFVLIDLLALSIPSSIGTMAGCWLVFYRRTRQDKHYANLLFKPAHFWKRRWTRDGQRQLVAGARPVHDRKKES